MEQVLDAAKNSKNHLMPPPTWENGKSGLVKVHRRSSEYRNVELTFVSSLNAPSTILGIERVQDLEQWKLYSVKIESFKDRYKKDPTKLLNNTLASVEKKWLYHGTDSKTAPKIVSQGFNRAFAGRNATSYGKGAYFAKYACYSHRYSCPDQHGIQKMFMCRVAVGDWCKGEKDRLTPDHKPGSTNELFDSTVNNVASPSIFVVYHDNQSYPEYVVTYTVNS